MVSFCPSRTPTAILRRTRYDPAGNILSKTVNGKTTVFTYDAANQLVSSECEGKVTQYDYDAAGRMVRDGGRTYRYGWLDKVTSITEDGSPYAAYGYHVDGQLASAKYADRQEDFLWDGLALGLRNNSTSTAASTAGSALKFSECAQRYASIAHSNEGRPECLHHRLRQKINAALFQASRWWTLCLDTYSY